MPSKIDQRLKKLIATFQKELAGVAIVVVKELEADFKRRIFNDGKATNGSKIGSYSTKGIYVNPSKPKKGLPKGKLSKLKPRGKNPKSGQFFKNGKKRKTAYLDDGYKQLRSVFGRQNQKIDLSLTGTLRLNIKALQRGSGAALAFTDLRGQLISAGQEHRKKKRIFRVSQAEKRKMFDNTRRLIRQAIAKTK